MQGKDSLCSAPFSASVISICAPGFIFLHVVSAAKTICCPGQCVMLHLAIDGRDSEVAMLDV
jgi:hypothetical protein